MGSLNPSRPSPGGPRGLRHVYHVSHLEYLTFDLIELQQCVWGLDRGFQGRSVLLNNSQVAYVTLENGLNGLSDPKNPWFDTSYMSLGQTIQKLASYSIAKYL